jgi:hypothetical protein
VEKVVTCLPIYVENPEVATNDLRQSPEETEEILTKEEVIKVADHLEEAAGTMAMEANLVDHITEMVIMTALDKTAVTAAVAAAVVAAGPLQMDKEWNAVAAILEAVVEAATMASTKIPVGRNRHVVNETTAAEVEAAEVNAGSTGGMTVGRLPLTIGPLRYRGTNVLRANCSRVAMDRLESISTAMRISRWKQPELMCLTALKTSIR